MLKGLAAWVLNNYLGQYVENLNTDQLSFGLLHGEVELESLPLKKDALDAFDLPIVVRAGFLGKVRLQIPVTGLRSQPWVMSIEQLYLVAGPLSAAEYDEEKDEQINLERKLSKLDLMEAKWRAEHEAKKEVSYYASSYSSWVSYGTSFVSNILENMQLKIKDVHIRFEDESSDPGSPFAWGITIESLEVQSSNKNWVPQYMQQENVDCIRKLVELHKLSVYWDSNARIIGGLPLSDLVDAMCDMLNPDSSNGNCPTGGASSVLTQHEYILEPVSAQARLQRNNSSHPLTSPFCPRLVCDLLLDAFPVSLSERQYDSAVTWLYEFERLGRARKYRKWRPLNPVHGHAQDWWQFAAQPHISETHQRHQARNWPRLIERARNNVLYVEAYMEHLLNPVTCPSALKNHKDRMEREVAFEELHILRDIAMERVLTLEETRVKVSHETDGGTGVLQSWFPLWKGWWYPAATATSSATLDSSVTTGATTPEEVKSGAMVVEGDVLPGASQLDEVLEKKLRDVLKNSEENDTLFRRDAAFAKINFSLKRGVFSLTTDQDVPTVARASNGTGPAEMPAKRALFELEISDVQIGLELRPRIRSTIFDINLGALYLRDKVMEGSMFPLLVAPQQKGEMLPVATPLATSAASYLASKLKGLSWGSSSSSGTSASKPKEDPLFQLTYETKPFRSTADCRLHVKSQSLDIIYNPAALRRIAEFFGKPHRRLMASGHYPSATEPEGGGGNDSFAKLRQQTREELQKNWDQLVGGEQPFSKRWDVRLDVSAPQIVFPENFFDADTTIVVLDFGRLQFATASSKVQQKFQDVVADSDDEDDFKTPCSSPPGDYDDSSPEHHMNPVEQLHHPLRQPVLTIIGEELAHCDITELSLRERMYDRYSLELSDLQVLVCKAKNNWKYAYFQGTSTMHVLDRFSITLQLERRIVFTSDPQWPSAMLSGTLPKLVVHVNEQKIGGLRTIVNLFDKATSGHRSSASDLGTSQSGTEFEPESLLPDGSDRTPRLGRSGENTPSVASSPEVNPDTRLLVVQFDVGQMCLDLQSRGRSIAELQVTSIKSCLTKRPRDVSIGLTVHGLLLVDALQTFGPDFELLMASHKNISIDSMSGSLRDSEPNSPTSPASPTFSSHPSCTSPIAINAALRNLQVGSATSRPSVFAGQASTVGSPPHWLLPPPVAGRQDEEALIVVQVSIVDQPTVAGTSGVVQTASIRFNSLDIIANQETIVELMGFFRQLIPSGSHQATGSPSPISDEQRITDDDSDEQEATDATGTTTPTAAATSQTQIELTFNFHRLNVLLLKSSLQPDGVCVAQKVATAAMSDACVRATFGGREGTTDIEGSLGGLQVLDLVAEGGRHPRVLSVGHDPIAEGHHATPLVDRLQADLYRKTWWDRPGESATAPRGRPGCKGDEAFCFTIGHSMLGVDGEQRMCEDGSRTVTLTLRMASVCYIHSARFLTDLASCASEFRQYMADLGTSLKVAATEVAMGLVRRSDLLATAFYGGSGGGGAVGGTSAGDGSASVGWAKSRAPSGGYRTAASTVPPSPIKEQPSINACRNLTDIRLNVLLESPVLVLPESPTSSRVLVAHLGRITVNNSRQVEIGQVGFTQQGAMTVNSDRTERVSVEVREMNLYSLDVEEASSSATAGGAGVSHARPHDVYTDTRRGFPILHDTAVVLTVDRLLDCHVIKPLAETIPTTFTLDEDIRSAETFPRHACDIVSVHGRVITPLKVSLSKSKYEQILRTIDSLTANEAGSAADHMTIDDDEDAPTKSCRSQDEQRPTKMSDVGRKFPGHRATDSPDLPAAGALAIKGLFELPEFTVELFGDLGEKGRDLVSLSFQDFLVDYEKHDSYTSNIQVTLRTCMMEDLLEEPHSRHRFLMTSSSGTVTEEEAEERGALGPRSRFLSSSCPDVSMPPVFLATQQSLPDKLNTENVFLNLYRMREKKMFGGCRHRPPASRQQSSHALLGGQCPCTPPPSPLGERDPDMGLTADDALVHIKILLVDPRCPDFATRYKSTQQFVDVNFNCLDTLVSLHSWVVVLDFFGIGGSSSDSAPPPPPDSSSRRESMDWGGWRSASRTGFTSSGTIQRAATEMEIQVRRLSLVLNKREYELARISVSNLVARVSNESNGDCTVVGKLGRLAVTDLTPHGLLYRERFTMAGYEVLDFHFFKYGTHDDGHTQRSHDASIKLEMSSVHYVHTNRFFAELLTFFQQFDQLQGIVERFRAAEGEVGREAGEDGLTAQPLHSRVLLDVRVGSPVVVVPVAAWSSDVLVADLGRLRLSNAFMVAGSPGTISKVVASSPAAPPTGSTSVGWALHEQNSGQPCLLDVMYVHLHDIDLFSAERFEQRLAVKEVATTAQVRFSTFVVRKKGGALLTEKCKFDLQLERNLDCERDHSVADASVRGALSTVHCRLDIDQYKLVRGILQHNLGEPLDDLELSDLSSASFPTANISASASSNQQPFPMHRGSSVSPWTRLSFHVDLHNVVVEFLLSPAATVGGQNIEMEDKAGASPLARVNFIKSRLTYESASDQSSFVDLVSQEILISDTRFDGLTAGTRRPNTFSNILQPTSRTGDGAVSAHSDLLQAELHYRFSRNQSGLTILLNNMQVIAIFDWWQTIISFLTVSVAEPPALDAEPSSQQVSRSVLASRYAISVSAGIATKRGSLIENAEPPFELKINVTDTGVVVVADASAWDTDAVTLKSTAVVRWRPSAADATNTGSSRDKPLSCTLQSLEVFSCVLGLEEDTALSIVDPVTINFDVSAHNAKGFRGLLDVAYVDVAHKLEVSVNDLHVRLSYHDVQLFLRIIDSLPQQSSFFGSGSGNVLPVHSPPHQKAARDLRRVAPSSDSGELAHFREQVATLAALGFHADDCRKALEANGGRLNDAALWLTQNASPSTIDCPSLLGGDVSMQSPSPPQLGVLHLHHLSVHVSTICLCLIDDCGDADVPLAEFTVSQLNMQQALDGSCQGNATFLLSGDYYDRGLSGWEPFLEPWGGTLAWETTTLCGHRPDKLSVTLEGGDVLDLNITSTLVQLYRSVQKNWTEDYYRATRGSDDAEASSSSSSSVLGTTSQDDRQRAHPFRQRSPFVPFALHNQTGCNLKFATITVNPEQLVQVDHQVGLGVSGPSSRPDQPDLWTDMGSDETKPFTFERRRKMRHRDTHEVKMHQLIVRIDGYQAVAPVSVDKVGTFFRHARPLSSRSAAMSEPPEARIVFVVTLEGSARKLVTVRSALLLDNRLGSTLEVRLENTALQFGAVGVFYLSPGRQMPVPLPYVGAHIFARPVDGDAHPVLFCSSPVQWQHVTRPGDIHEATYWCTPMSTRPNVRHYRFCASVHHQNYPVDATTTTTTGQLPASKAKISPSVSASASVSLFPVGHVQPGHIISFIPPVVLVNLLPCDLAYELRPVGDVRGVARPGQEVALHLVDLSETFEIRAKFENFVVTNDLVIQSGASSFSATLRAIDSQNRTLLLRAKVLGGRGCALRIHLSAPFWLVNKTGLPLVFRQESLSYEAAGQSAEHEMARSVSPLLFSFSDADSPALLTARVGRSVHPTGEPQWCSPFPLRPGIRCKRLCVMSRSERPDSIYSLGIDVRAGHGRYADVHVVTLVPRFHLDNHSSHHLEFSQKYALHNGHLEQVRLTAKSRSLLPFHWPRPDLDQLLCVRASDVSGCRWSSWSGGFCIDRAQSFHVNMRDANGRPFFLRAEIVLQGATYFVVLSDASQLPPPFRIDNLSDVPVSCHQTETTSESLRLSVRPHQSIPYAWDEPTLQSWITCTAPGGSRAKYNLNNLGEGKEQLSYENFIYIAFTETFGRRDGGPGYSRRRDQDDVRSRQLVLDVLDGTRVVIGRKEPGNRSQLWRMTSAGLLQHEGSSPPRSRNLGGRDEEVTSTSSYLSSSAPSPSGLVLDTADKAPLPTEHCPLVLRKQDPRRSLTQTWEFTEDGRLRCKFPRLFVQSADGFYGLVAGSPAVLGQSQPVIYSTTSRGIPTEQAVGRQKLWPGSGLLGVNVVADGPTRVLQILDVHQKALLTNVPPDELAQTDRRVDDAKRKTSGAQLEQATEKAISLSSRGRNLDVHVRLPRGLGVSLINCAREELVYVRLSDVALAYNESPSERSVDGSVRDVQVDNQLPESECPVLLFVSPASKGDMQQQMPAIRFVVKHVSSHHTNVDIFKPLMLEVKNLNMPIDERLLWKLAQFFGMGIEDEHLESLHEASESQRFSQVAEAALAKRYYFSLLKLSLNKVRLSMITDSRLPPDLAAIKNQMGLTLIRFEDAQVELDPFVRVHPFETSRFLVDSVVRHYKEELKRQAAKILVAFDFLGNPVGLVNDFSEGLSEFKDGNVGGLLKNVTHGLSNSAAKVTGTLSDGLGVVSMDDRHEVTRRKIRTEHSGSSSDHIVAGFKGLGFGLLSGMTSIVTQTYVGASEEGLPGFFTGFGKGLVGTFTKPAAGVLDLAASAASAVRDTSRGKNHYFPSQMRKRRLCVGPGGLLPRYSAEQSRGQELLYLLNNKDYTEMFIALEVLNYSNDGLRALVSSKSVYFLSQDSNSSSSSASRCAIILEVHFKDLYHCKIAKQMGDIKVTYYLELTTRAPRPPNSSMSNAVGEMKYNRPRVLCDTEEIALKATQQINYAKGIYEELVHTLGAGSKDASGE